MQPTPLADAAARPAGDVDALVTAHLPVAQFAVNAVAARIDLPGHVSREDLVAVARVALVEAARRYDPTKGASFSTYATTRCQGAVLDELRASDWATRSVRAEARRLNAAVDALTVELGRMPEREEIATRLGVDRSTLDTLHTNVHRATVISIDATEHSAADLLPSADTPERSLLGQERVGYLLDALSVLPDRVGEVVERNFFDDESLTDIAADLGLTLSRVSQMRAQGLRLLHAALSEILDDRPVAAEGGSRARAQQERFVCQVAGVSPDYRTRLTRRAPVPLAS